jgi:hypothetical protein
MTLVDMIVLLNAAVGTIAGLTLTIAGIVYIVRK